MWNAISRTNNAENYRKVIKHSLMIYDDLTSRLSKCYSNRHEFIELGNSWPPQRHFTENTIFEESVFR